MAFNYGPRIVTEGLVLHLDAADNLSYAEDGVIPARSESPFTTWSDYGGNTAHHTAIGDDGVILLNTSENAWIGSFPGNVTAGYWTMAFEYQASVGNTSTTQVEVNDDGTYTGNIFLDHVYATSIKQIFTKTANLGGTAASNFYFRRETDNGSNVTISNFRLYKSDSAGNSLVFNDLSGEGNNGSIAGATYNSANGGKLIFDGTDDYITQNFSVGNTSERTFSIWVNYDDFSNNGEEWTMTMSNLANNYKWTYFNLQGDGLMYFMFGDNSGYNIRGNTSGTVVTYGNWYNLVITVDRYQSLPVKIYSNGVSQALSYNNNGGNAIYDGTDMHLHIMAFNYQGAGTYYGHVDGDMSIASVYNRALTATEVLQNYNAQKSRFGL